MLLNLLHCRLRVQWPSVTACLSTTVPKLYDPTHRIGAKKYSRDNRPELVHTGRMGDGFAGVLGVAGEAEGLGAVEGNSVASLALRGGVGARKCGLFGSLSLSIGFC